jgi:hypothetical protein
MRDDDLIAGLSTVDGEAPSPEFLALLRDRLDAERQLTLIDDDDLLVYSPSEVDVGRRSPLVDLPAQRRRWIGGGVAIAVAAAIALFAVIALPSGDDGSGRVAAIHDEEHFGPGVLPDAVVQPGDGPVHVGPPLANPLDRVLGPEYRSERSTYEALGYLSGLAVDVDVQVGSSCIEVDSRSVDCADPTRGLSAAHEFPDGVSAELAVGLLSDHFRDHTAGVWQQLHPLLDQRHLDVELGDRSEAFVLTDGEEAEEVVVLVWRNGNIVHVLWDLHANHTPERVDAVVDLARAIDGRMAHAPG